MGSNDEVLYTSQLIMCELRDNLNLSACLSNIHRNLLRFESSIIGDAIAKPDVA